MHDHSPRLRVRVIGREIARPQKRVDCCRLARSDRDARHVGATPVIDRVFKLNGTPRTVGGQVEHRRIGDGEESPAALASDAGRVDRHRDSGHLEWPWLHAGPARLHRRREDVIGAGGHDHRRSRIGVVGREGARADERKRLAGLAGTGRHRAGGLRAPIVERIGKLNGATSGVCRDMEDRGIGEAGEATTGFARDTRGIDREIDARHGKGHRCRRGSTPTGSGSATG